MEVMWNVEAELSYLVVRRLPRMQLRAATESSVSQTEKAVGGLFLSPKSLGTAPSSHGAAPSFPSLVSWGTVPLSYRCLLAFFRVQQA